MARTALVTGGNRGIGYAIAEGLVARGHDVVIGARDPQAGAEAASTLGCRSVMLDLERPETLAPAVESAGEVGILVNNAGVLIDDSLIGDGEGFRRSVAVMFTGPYELIRLTVPGMGRRGWGRIVNLSSGWGAFAKGLEGPGAYGVAKAALNALTCALPRDLPDVVKVNAMDPGWVSTRMGGPTARTSPKEAAETAFWLAELPQDGPTGGFFRRRGEPAPW